MQMDYDFLSLSTTSQRPGQWKPSWRRTSSRAPAAPCARLHPTSTWLQRNIRTWLQERNYSLLCLRLGCRRLASLLHGRIGPSKQRAPAPQAPAKRAPARRIKPRPCGGELPISRWVWGWLAWRWGTCCCRGICSQHCGSLAPAPQIELDRTEACWAQEVAQLHILHCSPCPDAVAAPKPQRC